MASKGFRSPKKLTRNQLEDAIVELNANLTRLSGNVANELHRLNIVVFSLLKELGMVDEKECPNCGMNNLRPILSNLPIDPHCAECGHRIDPLPDEVFTDPEYMMDSEE